MNKIEMAITKNEVTTLADKTIGGEGQIDAEELERYLCRWCYNNGTPFTTITYSVDGGLSIKEDDGARRLYEQAFPYHDEPLLDADGNIIGIQTVANEERCEYCHSRFGIATHHITDSGMKAGTNKNVNFCPMCGRRLEVEP